MVSTELHDLPVVCKSSELRTFIPPAPQTCADWADDFVRVAGGYLVDPNATDKCLYCQYKVGDEFYAPFGFTFDKRWDYLGYLVAYTVFNCIVTIVASRFLKYAKR